LADENFLVIKPTESWIGLSEADRIEKVVTELQRDDRYSHIMVVNALDNGHVILRIETPMAASERGLFLLELERKLKFVLDEGLTIWLEPVGDKSKLRMLRGVSVKQ
jgi:hypothetical protein